MELHVFGLAFPQNSDNHQEKNPIFKNLFISHTWHDFYSPQTA